MDHLIQDLPQDIQDKVFEHVLALPEQIDLRIQLKHIKRLPNNSTFSKTLSVCLAKHKLEPWRKGHVELTRTVKNFTEWQMRIYKIEYMLQKWYVFGKTDWWYSNDNVHWTMYKPAV